MSDSPVRTPLSRRFRLWRRRFLPILVWGAAVAAVVVLGQRQSQRIDAVGIVERREVAVTPLIGGTIGSVAVDLLDHIEAGQVVAVMDDTLVRAELIVAEAELARLRATLEDERKRIERDITLGVRQELDDLRQFGFNAERSHIDLLDRLVQQETDKVTLQRLEGILERQKKMVVDYILEPSIREESLLRAEALRTQLSENEDAIALARRMADAAARRRAEREDLGVSDDEVDGFLGALREGIEVQEARIEAVRERRMMLALRAPLTGQVASMLHRTGETIQAGEPILTIAGEESDRVLAYVSEKMALEVAVGTQVELISKRDPRQIVTCKVLRVGSGIEEFPLRLWRNPAIPEWGYCLLVGDIPGGLFLPGESVDLRFNMAANGAP